MIPEIDFIRPQSLEEALQALAKFKEDGRPIAGGTDIIPGFHINSRRFRDLKVLINIASLPELTTIEWQNDGLHIGGAATFTAVAKHPIIKEKFPLLTQSALQIGSVQIRNRATLAGNFVNNAPCADSVPPLLVYNAEIVVQSLNNQRRLPLGDFLLKPYQTQLQPGELVREIILPELASGYRGEFYKLGRRQSVAISRLTLAVLVQVKNRIIEDIRIASGAITPIGKRFFQLEDRVKGQFVEDDLLKDLAISMGAEILEITGLRWSTAYKLPVVQQMLYAILKRLTASAEL